MTFLVNLIFRRLDSFDEPLFEGAGWTYIRGLIFEVLIRLHICGVHIRGGLIYGGRINWVLRYLSAVSSLAIITAVNQLSLNK